jgi:hypothetical protein
MCQVVQQCGVVSHGLLSSEEAGVNTPAVRPKGLRLAIVAVLRDAGSSSSASRSSLKCSMSASACTWAQPSQVLDLRVQ